METSTTPNCWQAKFRSNYCRNIIEMSAIFPSSRAIAMRLPGILNQVRGENKISLFNTDSIHSTRFKRENGSRKLRKKMKKKTFLTCPLVVIQPFHAFNHPFIHLTFFFAETLEFGLGYKWKQSESLSRTFSLKISIFMSRKTFYIKYSLYMLYIYEIYNSIE